MFIPKLHISVYVYIVTFMYPSYFMLKSYKRINFHEAHFHSTLLHFRHPLAQQMFENQIPVIFAKKKQFYFCDFSVKSGERLSEKEKHRMIFEIILRVTENRYTQLNVFHVPCIHQMHKTL